MNVSFQVRPDLAYWACDYGKFESGQPHVVENAVPGFVAQVASAAAQGSLIDVSYDPAAAKVAASAVEPDRQSLKTLARAIAEGTWQEGSYQQWLVQEEARRSGDAGVQLGGEG